MESLISKFTNELFAFAAYLKSGGLERKGQLPKGGAW